MSNHNSYDYIKNFNDPKVVEYFKIGFNSLEKSRSHLIEVVEEINMISLEITPNCYHSYDVVESAKNLYCHTVDVTKNVDKKCSSDISVNKLAQSQPR